MRPERRSSSLCQIRKYLLDLLLIGGYSVHNRKRLCSRRSRDWTRKSDGVAFRDFEIVTQILEDLDLRLIRQLTNKLTRLVGLRGFGLEISERIPIEVEPNGHNERYLKTKRAKLNHVFEKYLADRRFCKGS